ncbi:MAG: hypothetical protein WCI94_22295 [Rhodospirillales bacterium]
MPTIEVDGFLFAFPDGWLAGKYDDWEFYRSRWLKTWPGSKAVDLIAVAPERTVWLIEVKDYNHPQTEAPSTLPDIVARKVFDTLAALLPARVNAADPAERKLARLSTEATELRVVLHLEQRPPRSRLWPQSVGPANICQKLRKRLKSIHKYPLVSAISEPAQVPWRVVRA